MPRKKSSSRKKTPTTRRKRRRKKGVVINVRMRNIRIALGVLCMIFAALFVVALFGKAGKAGAYMVRMGQWLVGNLYYAIPLFFLWFGIEMIRRESRLARFMRTLGLLVGTVSIATFASLITHGKGFAGGGELGILLAKPALATFDVVGSSVLAFAVFLLAALSIRGWRIEWPDWLRLPRFSFNFNTEQDAYDDRFEDEVIPIEEKSSKQKKNKEDAKIKGEDQAPQQSVDGVTSKKMSQSPTMNKPLKVTGMNSSDTPTPKDKESKGQDAMTLNITSPMPSSYTRPELSLLKTIKDKPSTDSIEEYAETIQKTLANFNINIEMEEISVGPTVTRYAVKPAVGTKLSRIKGLGSELALALAAHPIRIEAPIPGKSLVGIEIPNKSKVAVGLAAMLADAEFQKSPKPLLASLGKSVSGKHTYADISKMPHMLIAGATGSGKSVTAHAIVMSLLYLHGPEEVRFIMVDPKRVELTLYNGIPHLLTPVIKTPKKALLALSWATKEMDRRYDVLEKHKVRDITSYHATIVEPAYAGAENPEQDSTLPERMPYIIVLIDEMADLMQSYPRELEASIVRLAQMSRAVGIHLILSTQRPSVNVITGLIKANVPARLALRVSSQIDSRTIIDTAGAETLLGKGDMLFKGGDMSKPTRIQCAYISEDEVKKVVKDIIKNNKEYLTDEIELPDHIDGEKTSKRSGSGDDDHQDELFDDARDLVINTGKASTSYLQRKFRIGYSRAARLIDSLEDAGIIGPSQGSKPRQILAADNPESTGDTPSPLVDSDALSQQANEILAESVDDAIESDYYDENAS